MEHSALFSLPTNRNPAQSLQDNAITVFGPRLYNSLPKYLRDNESVKTEKFKFKLDTFLEVIPDEPKMPNYVTASGSTASSKSKLIWGQILETTYGVLILWRSNLARRVHQNKIYLDK